MAKGALGSRGDGILSGEEGGAERIAKIECDKTEFGAEVGELAVEEQVEIFRKEAGGRCPLGEGLGTYSSQWQKGRYAKNEKPP